MDSARVGDAPGSNTSLSAAPRRDRTADRHGNRSYIRSLRYRERTWFTSANDLGHTISDAAALFADDIEELASVAGDAVGKIAKPRWRRVIRVATRVSLRLAVYLGVPVTVMTVLTILYGSNAVILSMIATEMLKRYILKKDRGGRIAS